MTLNLTSIAVIGGAILIGGSGLFILGHLNGVKHGRIEQLKDTIAAEKARDEIDSITADMGDYELCIYLGGMPEQCAELRRMEETAEP